MLPYYGYESSFFSLDQEPHSMMKSMDGGDSTTFSSGTTSTTPTDVIKSTAAACKSHKEAERRRRQRINAHLSTLRTLLPSKTKTDKASLLAEVVHHVKELRERFADVAGQDDGDGCCSSSSCNSESEPLWPLLPTETDEVKLSYCDGEGGMVKAILCCEDRPGLNRELSQAIRSVRARAVKAEMVTVGGRTKSVLVMQCGTDGGGGGGGGSEDAIGTLKRALKVVVEKRVSGSEMDRVLPESKRGRFYGSAGGDGLLLGSV